MERKGLGEMVRGGGRGIGEGERGRGGRGNGDGEVVRGGGWG